MKLVVEKNKKYCLAVSGGVDSMVLLRLFCDACDKKDFFVVTINHNLRENAKSDCDFVKNECSTLGIECVEKSVNVEQFAKENGLSIETAGRILRYKVFEEQPCDFVVLAHHKNDNVESVLMHLLRGSGATGALGMKKKQGKYFRPLLDFSKAEILDYAKENDVRFVQDETNFQSDFARNYLRNEICPRLEKINQGYADNVLRFSSILQQDDDFLNSLVDLSKVEFSNESATILKEGLVERNSLSVRLLKKTFETLGYSKDIEKVHFDAILSLCEKKGEKRIDLPFGLVAVNSYDKIIIEKKKEKQYYDFCKKLEKENDLPTCVVNLCQSKSGLRFDFEKLPQDCVIRYRKKGDVFEKFGGGTKKLKDWFIDKKIPLHLRDEIPLIAKGNEIFIVVGYEVCDSIKVDKTTQVIYNVSITQKKN